MQTQLLLLSGVNVMLGHHNYSHHVLLGTRAFSVCGVRRGEWSARARARRVRALVISDLRRVGRRARRSIIDKTTSDDVETDRCRRVSNLNLRRRCCPFAVVFAPLAPLLSPTFYVHLSFFRAVFFLPPPNRPNSLG